MLFLSQECGVRNKACQVGHGNSDTASEEYGGFERHTINRIECQMWKSDIPHGHDCNSLAEDWCRNPDGEAGVWCYTMNVTVRWELCGVRRCSYCDTGHYHINNREN